MCWRTGCEWNGRRPDRRPRRPPRNPASAPIASAERRWPRPTSVASADEPSRHDHTMASAGTARRTPVGRHSYRPSRRHVRSPRRRRDHARSGRAPHDRRHHAPETTPPLSTSPEPTGAGEPHQSSGLSWSRAGPRGGGFAVSEADRVDCSRGAQMGAQTPSRTTSLSQIRLVFKTGRPW